MYVVKVFFFLVIRFYFECCKCCICWRNKYELNLVGIIKSEGRDYGGRMGLRKKLVLKL